MKKAQILWLLVFLASACGSSPNAATPGSPSTSSAPARSPSPSVGVAASLTCRLPVVASTLAKTEPPGGWITFPGGQFVRDTASLGKGSNPSYNQTAGAWVPGTYRVAPDGATYLFQADGSAAKPYAI